MTRYRLPEILGGGEVDALETWGGCAGGRPEYRIEGITVTMPAGTPMEPVDTTPPEPEPGAWLIGDVPVIRSPDSQATYPWLRESDHGAQYDTWADTWKALGGPGITPRRLVPEPAPVELPWEGSSSFGRHLKVHRPDLGLIPVAVGEDLGELAPDTAEEMAAALLAAARAAREATP